LLHVLDDSSQIHLGLWRDHADQEIIELGRTQTLQVLIAEGSLYPSRPAVVTRNSQEEKLLRVFAVLTEISSQEDTKVGCTQLDVLVGPRELFTGQESGLTVNELAGVQSP
jgi:hypothetical protein